MRKPCESFFSFNLTITILFMKQLLFILLLVTSSMMTSCQFTPSTPDVYTTLIWNDEYSGEVLTGSFSLIVTNGTLVLRDNESNAPRLVLEPLANGKYKDASSYIYSIVSDEYETWIIPTDSGYVYRLTDKQ